MANRIKIRKGRIIPALAGNTSRSRSSRPAARDHPRSRGEYWIQRTKSRIFWGSSPLSRGKLGRVALQELAPRIIPALAGNTNLSDLFMNVWRDHPRSRGEYSSCVYYYIPLLGSSPLSRGIPEAYRPRLNRVRIIPALAGNTVDHVFVLSWPPDHPRSRGEYALFREHYANGGGSSPLSRGIR